MEKGPVEEVIEKIGRRIGRGRYGKPRDKDLWERGAVSVIDDLLD